MIPMLRTCVLAAALLAIANSIVWAEDQAITLRLGSGSALRLERPFETVLIGDPGIVEVHTQDDRSVILVPLNVGTTNVVFVDRQSIAIANVRVLVRSASAAGGAVVAPGQIADDRFGQAFCPLMGLLAGESGSTAKLERL
jgi:Flp pilus assembly secretin CpaC